MGRSRATVFGATPWVPFFLFPASSRPLRPSPPSLACTWQRVQVHTPDGSCRFVRRGAWSLELPGGVSFRCAHSRDASGRQPSLPQPTDDDHPPCSPQNHAFREVSHRRHHSNTGSVSKDEVFVPPAVPSPDAPRTPATRALRTATGRAASIAFALTLGWPSYLAFNVSGRPYPGAGWVSHYDPASPIFSKRERAQVAASDAGVVAALALLYALGTAIGFPTLAALYGAPLLVVNGWLVLITLLQHTHPALPHYDDADWDWLRGKWRHKRKDGDTHARAGGFRDSPKTNSLPQQARSPPSTARTAASSTPPTTTSPTHTSRTTCSPRSRTTTPRRRRPRCAKCWALTMRAMSARSGARCGATGASATSSRPVARPTTGRCGSTSEWECVCVCVWRENVFLRPSFSTQRFFPAVARRGAEPQPPVFFP